ncbi:hypothetical protein GTA51_19140 [Desulfovibrio aerotolerans]|uniref:Uncharacterized protein n=1 Tax=Solidesulfovibrio aerotolerans TaxID=295255 RepID=A0A7C9NM70_9BACT|nr:MFS transporter [Solidesulfovibrio aerotolerans]MYL85216.1 hypothetical protein [Solidesulfovibrio aerotolerans]
MKDESDKNIAGMNMGLIAGGFMIGPAIKGAAESLFIVGAFTGKVVVLSYKGLRRINRAGWKYIFLGGFAACVCYSGYQAFISQDLGPERNKSIFEAFEQAKEAAGTPSITFQTKYAKTTHDIIGWTENTKSERTPKKILAGTEISIMSSNKNYTIPWSKAFGAFWGPDTFWVGHSSVKVQVVSNDKSASVVMAEMPISYLTPSRKDAPEVTKNDKSAVTDWDVKNAFMVLEDVPSDVRKITIDIPKETKVKIREIKDDSQVLVNIPDELGAPNHARVILHKFDLRPITATDDDKSERPEVTPTTSGQTPSPS